MGYAVAMHEVALHLQKVAMDKRGNAEAFDQFGRSAFNRYYYSLFLEVRSLIREFEPDWAGAHAQLPHELTGWVTKEIKSKRKVASSRGQRDILPILDRGVQSLQALANLLKSAYSVRVTADYNPDVKISDLGTERFSLASVHVTEAHNWLGDARHNLSLVRRAWRLTRGIA